MTSETSIAQSGLDDTTPRPDEFRRQAPDSRATSGVDDRDIRIIYVTIGCVGILGNAFVVTVMLLRRKLLKRIANNLIFNQSVVDLLGSLSMVAVSSPKINGRFDFSGPGGSFLCKVLESNAFLFGFFVVSTYNMLALTAERYMQIVFPLVHKAKMTHEKAHLTIAIIWLIGQCYVYALAVTTSEVIDGRCRYLGVWPNADVQRGVGIFHAFVLFLFPLPCIIYLYGHMLYAVRRRSRVGPMPMTSATTGPASVSITGQARMGRAQRNLLKIICLVTISFIVCWSMNQVYFMLINCGYDFGFTSPFYHFTVIMTFVNSCINPFIYILKYAEFKTAVKELFAKPKSGLGPPMTFPAGGSTRQTAVTFQK